MLKGIELLDFLLIRKQRKMKTLDAQIRDITNNLEPLKDSEEFLKLSGDLDNKLFKWDLEIQNKNKNKFIRDLDDFSGGHIFKWHNIPVPASNTVVVPVINTISGTHRINPIHEYAHPQLDRYSSPQRDSSFRGYKWGKNNRVKRYRW